MQSEDKLGVFTVNQDARVFTSTKVRTNEVVAMDDHVLGVIYASQTDKFAYSTFMQHGAPITTSKLITNKGQVQSIGACRFDNNIFTIPQVAFNSKPSTIFAQMIDQNGDTVDPLLTVEDGYESSYGNCIQYSSTLIGIFYSSKGIETGSGISHANWDLYTRTYNPITKALSGRTRVNNARDGFQGQNNIVKVSSTKFVMALDGQDYPSYGTGKRHIYLQEFDNMGSKVNNNILVPGTHNGAYSTPHIAVDTDGSLSVAWIISSNVYYGSYNSGNLATAYNCKVLVSNASSRITLTVHDGIAYIQYRKTDGKPYIKEIKTSDCSEHKAEYKQEDSDNSVNILNRIIVSDTPESTYLIFTRQYTTANPGEDLKIIMYLLEQKTPCTPNKCAGCNIDYGGGNCPVCAGTTKEERERRTTLDGTCSCQTGYYDDGVNQNCQQCASNCQECTLSSCTVCDDGYYPSGTSCLICPLPYLKCTAVDTPTECKTGVQRGDLVAKCVCNPGWVEQSGQVDCLQCTSPCKTCSTNQTTCDSCEDNYYLTVNTCTQCPLPFAKCTGASSPTECKVGTGRLDHTQNCECDFSLGFVEVSGQLNCVSCNSPCKTCRTDQDTCHSCEDNYYLTGNTCTQCPLPFAKCTASDTPTECKVATGRQDHTQNCECDFTLGFVELTGQLNCASCHSPCKTCRTDQNTCHSCVDNYYLTGNTCTQCPLPFAKCTAVDTPTECKVGVQRGNLAAKCVCNPGWVEQSGLVDCLQCTSPCKTCSTNQTTCESCEDNYYLNVNTCIQCPLPFAKCTGASSPTECKVGTGRLDHTQNCECDFSLGFVEVSGQLNCVSCNSPCKTCRTDQDTCYSCEDNYYLNGTSCVQCPLPFSKCTGETSPTECKVATGRQDHTQNCECDFNLGFVELTGQLNCVSCNSPCKTCRTDQDTCHSCEDNYYLTGNTCTQCPLPFAKCIAEDTPTECKVGVGRSTEISENCICKEGFYEISNQLNCEKCSFPCQSCEISSLQCLTCLIKDGPGRNTAPNCLCKEGYYLMNLECIECDNTVCGTCSLAADNCIKKCDPNCETCNTQGKCLTCKDGLFMNSGECEDCGQDTCKKCDNQRLCIECQNPNLLPPDCQKMNKGQLVQYTEKSDGTSEIIISQCDAKCQQCTNDSKTCTKCSYSQNRNLNLPCSCLEGFHDNNGTTQNCEQCPPLCKSCLDGNHCIECLEDQNMERNLYSQMCQCVHGYKFNIEANICQRCYMYLGECFFTCPQNKKQNEKLFICEEIQYNEVEFIYLYWLCAGSILFFLIFFTSFSTVLQNKISKTENSQNRIEQKKQNIPV